MKKWLIRIAAETPIEAGLTAAVLAGWLVAIAAGLVAKAPSAHSGDDITLTLVPYAIAFFALRTHAGWWKLFGVAALAIPSFVSWRLTGRTGWISGSGATIGFNALIAALTLLAFTRARRTKPTRRAELSAA